MNNKRSLTFTKLDMSGQIVALKKLFQITQFAEYERTQRDRTRASFSLSVLYHDLPYSTN